VRDRELDTPTKILGGVANLLLPSPSMIKQAVQDPSGTVRGAAELVSLGDPIANTMRGINLVRGKGFSLYDADMSDVEQAAELAGLFPGGKAVSAPLKAAARVAPRVGRVAEDIVLSPVGMLVGIGGGGGRYYGKNAVEEANRVREVITRPIEDLRLDLSRLEPDDIAGKRRIEEQIARQQEFIANDAILQQADITPDVKNVTRTDLIGYKLVDPTSGTWGASIRKMTRDDIAKSLKATLKNGFERQKGSGIQPDKLPDFKSKDWEDSVDRFIAVADVDNLVRTTGPGDQSINWLSLANDHIEALKNPDKPGSNTIDNLIASYGRLNSRMGDKS
jgi:hypothetical protein